MLCQATWLPIKAKPRRWLVLASRVIGLSLKEWFSSHANRLARRGRKTRHLFTKCKWLLWRKMVCSSRPDSSPGEMLKALHWRPPLTLTCTSAQHIHIWAVERGSQRVVINHRVKIGRYFKKYGERPGRLCSSAPNTVIMAPAQRAASRNWWNSTNTDIRSKPTGL